MGEAASTFGMEVAFLENGRRRTIEPVFKRRSVNRCAPTLGSSPTRKRPAPGASAWSTRKARRGTPPVYPWIRVPAICGKGTGRRGDYPYIRPGGCATKLRGIDQESSIGGSAWEGLSVKSVQSVDSISGGSAWEGLSVKSVQSVDAISGGSAWEGLSVKSV